MWNEPTVHVFVFSPSNPQKLQPFLSGVKLCKLLVQYVYISEAAYTSLVVVVVVVVVLLL